MTMIVVVCSYHHRTYPAHDELGSFTTTIVMIIIVIIIIILIIADGITGVT